MNYGVPVLYVHSLDIDCNYLCKTGCDHCGLGDVGGNEVFVVASAAASASVVASAAVATVSASVVASAAVATVSESVVASAAVASAAAAVVAVAHL